jgi:predicted DNA-binding transcriptional regulator AlpA
MVNGSVRRARWPNGLKPGVRMTDVIAYPSKTTLARQLDCSESTIEEWVRRLPLPIRFPTGAVRWDWSEVQTAIYGLKQPASPPIDPLMEGARRVAQEIAAKMNGRTA